MDTDQLIQCLLNRDTQALQQFAKMYSPLMQYVVSPFLKDARDREECINQITLSVWEKIHLYDPDRGSFNSWVTAISRNAAINFSRKLSRQILTEPVNSAMPSAEPSPEEQAILAERRSLLCQAVQNLSETDQLLFYRRYYYHQSLSQIAAEMGMSLRSAEGKLYRIKKKLAKELGGETDDR